MTVANVSARSTPLPAHLAVPQPGHRLRACFVALNAYPLFDSSFKNAFGGMETRAWLFATRLARRCRVDTKFVVADHGQPRRQRVQGVEVVAYPHHPNARQQFSPKVNPFYLGMDADVYLTFGVNWLSAEVAVSAAECGRQSIVCIASDYDLADIYRPGSRERSPGGEFANACYQALTRADRVLVQTQRQEDLARQRFGVDPIRIGNPVDLPRRRPSYSRGIAHYALWVGRSDTFHKRPMLCLELAKRNPAIPFLMILNRYDDQVHRAVERDAPPNVLLTERVAFHEMAWYYRRARVLLSTASAAFEGCPNTFLQAGAHGVPVLSLEADPGRMLASGCGYCAEGDLDALDCRLASLWREPRIAEEARARMWAHLDREHDADARTAELERFLLSL